MKKSLQIHEKFNLLIKELGLSSREFGELLDPKTIKATVCQWRNGVHAPSRSDWREQIESLSNGEIKPSDWDRPKTKPCKNNCLKKTVKES